MVTDLLYFRCSLPPLMFAVFAPIHSSCIPARRSRATRLARSLGDHKVRIVLVDGNHEPYPGQSRTVKFTVRGTGVADGPSPSR